MPDVPVEAVLRHLRQVALARESTDQPDAQLLQRFAAGHEEAAFSVLVRRHGPMVLGVCRRVLGDWHAAEDAFQATFFVLARKAASIRKGASLGSWLYGVALRLAGRARANAVRRLEREKQVPPRTTDSPEADVSWREVARTLDEELNRLPERYRAPLVLCYLEGYTQDESARHLGWALRTLKRRLSHGRDLLRTRLGRRGVTLSAALCATALAQQMATAAIPATLTDTVVKGAIGFVTGATTGGQVAPLAEEFLRSLIAAKVRSVTFVVVMLGVLAAGLGWAAHRAFVKPPPDSQPPPELSARTPGPADGPDAEDPTKLNPCGLVARLGPVGFRHGAAVNCVAVAPDGKWIASGDDAADATVRVWEAKNGKERYRFEANSRVLAVAFSRDGKTLAAGGDDRVIHLLDAESGKEMRKLCGHSGRVASVVFAPDDKRLFSASHDGTVRLWDVDTAMEVGRFNAPGYALTTVAVSPDGTTLAAGCQNLSKGDEPGKTAMEKFSHPIRFWDVEKRQEIVPPKRGAHGGVYHTGPVRAIAFTPDSKKLASGGMDASVFLWDAEKGTVVREYRPMQVKAPWAMQPPGQQQPAAAIAFQAKQCEMWPIQALAFSPSGKTLAVGGIDCCILTFETDTGKMLNRYAGHYERPGGGDVMGVLSIAFSPDGNTLVSGGADARVRLWNVADAEEQAFGGHRFGIASIAFSLDGKTLATGGRDQAVYLWDAVTGQQVRRLHAPTHGQGSNQVSAAMVRYSPDGKILAAAGDDGHIRLWDAQTSRELSSLGDGKEKFVSVQWLADSRRLISVSQGLETIVRLWDIGSGRELRPDVAVAEAAPHFVVSPDGRFAAVLGPARQVVLWDLDLGKEIRRVNIQADFTYMLVFSPDSKVFATSGGGAGIAMNSNCAVRLWDVESGKEIRRLAGKHEGPVLAIAFSPDGQILATGGLDRTVRQWDVASGEAFPNHLRHQNPVVCVAFSADGKTVASGSHDGTALIWTRPESEKSSAHQ
jgi:RNA polymerase sigma factor (sigma-70 family)